MSTKMKTLARWQGSTWILGTFKEFKGKKFEIIWSDGTLETLTKFKAGDVILDSNLILAWFVSPEVGQVRAWESSPEKFAAEALRILNRPMSPNELKQELSKLKIPKESLASEWNGIKKHFEQNDHVAISDKPTVWSWSDEPIAKKEQVSNIDLVKSLYAEEKDSGEVAEKILLKERLAQFTTLELVLAWGIDEANFPNLPEGDYEIPNWSKTKLINKILASDDLDDQVRFSAVEKFVPVRDLAKWLEDPDSESQSLRFAEMYSSKCSAKDMATLLAKLKLKSENRSLIKTLVKSLLDRGSDFLKDAGFSTFLQGTSHIGIIECGLDEKSISKILRLLEKEKDDVLRQLTFRMTIQSTSLTDESKGSLLASASFVDWQTFYSDMETRRFLNQPRFYSEIVLPLVTELLGKTQARDQLVAALALPSVLAIDLPDEYKKAVKRVSASDKNFAGLFLDESLHYEVEETLKVNADLQSRLEKTVDENNSLKEKNSSLETRIDDLMRENLQFQNANVEALSGELDQASIAVARKWSALVTQTLRDISRLPDQDSEMLRESVIEGCKAAGLTVLGIPGQRVEIDPLIHDLLGSSSNGWGIVSDPGYKWLQNNNEVLLARALVVPAE